MPLQFLREGMDWLFGSIFLGQVSDTPTDSEIGEGNIAFYAKPDGELYYRPYGGTESVIGGGGGGGFDHTLSESLDAQSNDIENVGSLHTDELQSEGLVTETDDFSADTSDEWTVHSGSPTWDTTNNLLTVDSPSITLLTHNSGVYGTGKYTVDVQSVGSSKTGVVFGLQDSDNFYHVRLHADYTLEVYVFENGSATLLQESPDAIPDWSVPRSITVDWTSDSGEIRVYVDDTEQSSDPEIVLTDTTFGEGRYGLRSNDGSCEIYRAEVGEPATTTISPRDITGDGTSTLSGYKSISSESVRGDKVYTVEGGDAQNIADAINAGHKRIETEPGAVYTADETVFLEPGADTYHIDARGSGFLTTGEHPVFEIENTAVYGESDEYDGGEQGRIDWKGGVFVGQGKGATTALFTMTDCFGSSVIIGNAKGADNAIYLRNRHSWSEGNTVGHTDQNPVFPDQSLTFDDGSVEITVRVEAATAAFPDSGLGTESFRDLEVYMPYGAGLPSTFHQNGAIMGGHVYIHGFRPQDGTPLWYMGSDCRGATADIEFEQGTADSVGIDIQTETGIMPTLYAPRLRGPGTHIRNPHNRTLVIYDNNGVRAGGRDGEGYEGWGKFLDFRHSPDSVGVHSLDLDDNGARLYTNDNGDVLVDDENGNTINLSDLV